MRPPLDPNRSWDRDLSQDVAARWWGSSQSLDIQWRAPAKGDRVHPDGTPLVHVIGSLNRTEAKILHGLLDQLLGSES